MARDKRVMLFGRIIVSSGKTVERRGVSDSVLVERLSCSGVPRVVCALVR